MRNLLAKGLLFFMMISTITFFLTISCSSSDDDSNNSASGRALYVTDGATGTLMLQLKTEKYYFDVETPI